PSPPPVAAQRSRVTPVPARPGARSAPDRASASAARTVPPAPAIVVRGETPLPAALGQGIIISTEDERYRWRNLAFALGGAAVACGVLIWLLARSSGLPDNSAATFAAAARERSSRWRPASTTNIPEVVVDVRAPIPAQPLPKSTGVTLT